MGAKMEQGGVEGISPAGRCFKRHPLQLALRELGIIKALFADPALVCRPGVSLYYEGLRNRGLRVGLSTFYKYTARTEAQVAEAHHQGRRHPRHPAQ
ncbi:MAG: hypothetical protein KF797_14095 [Flavobacteriales bacterium]|nr:hypothetical protein [Flavobacteriales bacterium]